MRNAFVAIDASFSGLAHGCMFLPAYAILLLNVHEDLRMAIPAFARVRGFHGVPDLLRQLCTMCQEFLPRIDSA